MRLTAAQIAPPLYTALIWLPCKPNQFDKNPLGGSPSRSRIPRPTIKHRFGCQRLLRGLQQQQGAVKSACWDAPSLAPYFIVNSQEILVYTNDERPRGQKMK